jgi:hypothetical protein
MALVLASSPWASSPFGPALVVLLMIPALFLFAPQTIRKDKRTVAALVMLAAVVIGVPVYAVVCNICEVCKTCAWYYCPLECWFL